jgi:hypothetical protein
MWEHRCKVAVSGVGFSRVTRSAERPLAAHALEAVTGAVEDSGLALSDIDGLATYPELPATGHAVIDGVTIVSVNCMMAMLKLPNLAWHVQVETVNIGGAVQQAVNALLAGVCRYAVVWRAMHNPKGTYQNLTAWANRGLPPSTRATVLSTLGQAESFGEIAGGPLLGLVATVHTVRVALIGAAAVLLPAFPLYAMALRRDPERVTPTAQ